MDCREEAYREPGYQVHKKPNLTARLGQHTTSLGEGDCVRMNEQTDKIEANIPLYTDL